MSKRANRFGRVLLAVGTSLTLVVLVETHQNLVNARSLQPSTQTATQAATLPPPSPPPAADLSTASPSGSATPYRSAQAATPIAQAATPDNDTVAVSAGNPGESAQDLSSMTANQIAATRADTQWLSASFPLEQFQAYTSPFGYRRSVDGYNFNEFHYGLDMAAPQGSYTRSWWTGQVVEVSDDTNCGTSVVVESGDWLSIFCHLEGHVEESNGERYMIDRDGGLRIVEGQTVEAGQRLGRVGMSGRTTGPHLHWGLKYNNNWVDPALVLRAMYNSQITASSRTN